MSNSDIMKPRKFLRIRNCITFDSLIRDYGFSHSMDNSSLIIRNDQFQIKINKNAREFNTSIRGINHDSFIILMYKFSIDGIFEVVEKISAMVQPT